MCARVSVRLIPSISLHVLHRLTSRMHALAHGVLCAATQPKATKVMGLRIGLSVSKIQSLELQGQILKFNQFVLFLPKSKLGFFGRDPKKRQVVPAMVSHYRILSASAEGVTLNFKALSVWKTPRGGRYRLFLVYFQVSSNTR